MNFTTDLPKKDPIVRYIVASAIKCEKYFPGSAKEGPAFRMHAVILSKKPSEKLSLKEMVLKIFRLQLLLKRLAIFIRTSLMQDPLSLAVIKQRLTIFSAM